MDKFYYTRIKSFDGEDGFRQIQIHKGKVVIDQWLPNVPEVRKEFENVKAQEVTMDQLLDLAGDKDIM